MVRRRTVRLKGRPAGRERAASQWYAPVVLFALALLVYAPALAAQFVWDDDASVARNELLRGWGGLWRIWTSVGAIGGERHYWPMTYSVLWIEKQICNSPAGFHFGNMLLHAAVVVQIWRLMRRIGLKGAFFGAALFAVHPVHVEAVAWVISVKDLLATLMFLTAFELYLNYDERGGWRWLAASGAAAMAAMLSKSSPVFLPAALAIWVWYRRGRFGRRDVAGMAAIGVVTFSVAALDIYLGAKLNSPHDIVPGLAERIIQAGMSFWFYTCKLLVPIGLSVVYAPVSAPAWLSWGAIALVSALLVVARGRIGRGPLACWLFYGAALAPVLGIIHFHFLTISPVADRYQYLASVVPLAAAGTLAAKLAPRLGNARYAAGAVVLIALSVMTLRQIHYFRDERTLFERALAVSPDSAGANWCMGTHAMKKRDWPAAERYLTRTLEINGTFWTAALNLGFVLSEQGRPRDAVAVLRDAAGRGCSEPGVLNNLAWMLATRADPQIRNPKKALEYARRCVALEPDNPVYLNSQAAALAANGKHAEAIVTAEKALARARETSQTGLADALEREWIPVYRRGESMGY